LGAVLTGYIVWPSARLLTSFGLIKTKVGLQVLVKAHLAIVNASSLVILRRGLRRVWGVERKTDKDVRANRYLSLDPSTLWTVITIAQFHIPFWAGRTLPNMYAFALVQAGLTTWLTRSKRRTARGSDIHAMHVIHFLGFAALVFRQEVGLLLVGFVFEMRDRAHWKDVIVHSLGTAGVALALTVPLDNYLWNRPFVIAEVDSFWFNVVQGHAREWGTEPIHAYFSRYLPKLLNLTIPFLVVGILVDRRTATKVLRPVLVFVAGLSMLGHKEWRFIVYIIPLLNGISAKGMSKAGRSRPYAAVAVMSVLLALVVATPIMTTLSALNYPGAQAMIRFHQIVREEGVKVHIDTFSATTGVTRFLELRSSDQFGGIGVPLDPWIYSKEEGLTEFGQFTHLLTEDPKGHPDFDVLATVKALSVPSPRPLLASIKQVDLTQTTDLITRNRIWIMRKV